MVMWKIKNQKSPTGKRKQGNNNWFVGTEGRISSVSMAATPEGRCQPTKESGDCWDCSCGGAAAHPATDSAQVRLTDLLQGEKSAKLKFCPYLRNCLVDTETQFLLMFSKNIVKNKGDGLLIGTEDTCILDMVETHLSGPIDSKFEAAADNIETEANKPMEHSFNRGTRRWKLNLFLLWIWDRRIHQSNFYLKSNTRLACGGEYSPDDAAQSHQELPQWHVLLADRHHQRAGVVLHKDAGNAVTARCVVYHPLLEKRNNTVRSQVSV